MSIKLNKRAVIAEAELRAKLEDGKMPSSSDVLMAVLNENTVKRSSGPAELRATMLEGNRMDNKLVNDLIEEIEVDMLTMRLTLDEAWDNIRTTVDKLVRSLPPLQRDAEMVQGIATRCLSLIPEADAVRVGSEAISISSGVNFSTVNGADMELSSGIEVDLAAGALTLARSAVSAINGTTTNNQWEVTGEYQLRTERTLGNPTWTVDGDISKTWSVLTSSPSEFGEVKLTAWYQIPEGSDPLKRVEIVCPDFTETQVDVYVDFDGMGNYELWSTGNGRGQILIDGPSMKVRGVRMELRRFRSNERFMSGSAIRYGYTFQISEIHFIASSYVKEGNVVTDSIPMNYNQIMSTKVDVEATIPTTSILRTYIARDVDGADSLDDFRWVEVTSGENIKEITNTRSDSQFVTAAAPQKIRTGAGAYSNSIYAIGRIEGTLVSAYEGHDQIEINTMTVQPDEDGNLPAVSEVTFTGSNYPVSRKGSTLSGGNFYRIRTSIFSDRVGSQDVTIVVSGDVEDSRRILLNGSDITQTYLSGQIALSLNPGKNDLVILCSTGATAASVDVSVGDAGSSVIAIAQPSVVQEMSLFGSESKIALSGENLLVNHDPTGMVYLVTVKRPVGSQVGAVRIRVQLIRGVNGETPQLRRAFVTAGI